MIKDSVGLTVWKGQPEGKDVAWATSVPDSEDGLALYEAYPAGWQHMGEFRNLVRVSPTAEIMWHAELPEAGTKYVNAELVSGGLRAFASSYEVTLDLKTGKIVKQTWTK